MTSVDTQPLPARTAEPLRRHPAMALLPPIAAAGIALLIALVALAALGYSISNVLGTVWAKVLVPPADRRFAAWSYLLQYSTPILLTGLAVAVAFRAAVWNIGAQGQYLSGAIAATAIGVYMHLPAVLLIPVLLIGGIIGGAILASIAAILQWRRGVNVVLSTLLLNFIALELLRFLLQGPMRDVSGQIKSPPLRAAATLPSLGPANLHIGLLIALAAAAIVWFILRQTTFGFRLRVVGENPVAARFAGMNVPMVSVATLALSGGLAGLAGAIEVSGVTHELLLGVNDSGVGFTGVAVALLGRLSPLGVVAAALFFGLLNAGFRSLQAEMDVPFVTGQALQGLIIILMLVFTHPRAIRFLRRKPAAL